ncbi:MAG TPA: WecB/TagA/CpsF family glycosyltransferase [Verrucomicrobiae bacterium]|nr:WecB/TagA/CpsF family glycosyltransferase [Verrucomicrobiae bacterium]
MNNSLTLRAVDPLPIAILGIPFHHVTVQQAIERVDQMIASREPHYLVTPNVDFLVQARRDIELRRILCEAHLVVCDGTPLVWASRLLGNRLPERVAGADLVPLLIEMAAQKGHRIFLLGASDDSLAQAVENLRSQYPDLLIAGQYSPPFNRLLEMDHEQIRARIIKAQPDLLLVSLGCPKQEKWIAMHYRALGVPVTAGVGATIDFLAGKVRRAPRWMQRSGAEWLFRLAQEPGRLCRRYIKDLWVFNWSILAQWWFLQLRSPPTKPLILLESPYPKRPDSVPLSSPSSKNFDLDKDNDKGADNAFEGTFRAAETADAWNHSSAHFSKDEPHCIQAPASLDLETIRDAPPVTGQMLAGGQHCCLDLGSVTFIDSSGVGFLIGLQKQLRAAGRQLVLLRPSRAVRRALGLMRLEEFFASAPDLPAARELISNREREAASQDARVALLGPGVLVWQGEVTAANADEVWELARARLAMPGAPPHWTVDMAQVRFIDSSGLGIMVRAKKMARQSGHTLAFANLQPPVQNVLKLARLEEFLLK